MLYILLATLCIATTTMVEYSRATTKAALLLENLRVMRYLDDGGGGGGGGGWHWEGLIAILISYYSRFPAFI
jgi:hypothetical protein